MQPELTTQAMKDLGIVEQVSTFTTQFPYNPPRTTNIRIAAGTLDGILVRPGETFSLNGALGQRTPEKGYQQAPVINGGRLTRDYGGGVSQVSTTLFNAVFFAGLNSLSHKAHSFYIPRYPEGREATVDYPSVDQTFRNDSGHGILIKTAVSGSELTVSFYGTKVWDIEAVKSARTNIKQPRTIHDTDGSCVAQSPTPASTSPSPGSSSGTACRSGPRSSSPGTSPRTRSSAAQRRAAISSAPPGSGSRGGR